MSDDKYFTLKVEMISNYFFKHKKQRAYASNFTSMSLANTILRSKESVIIICADN